MGSNFFLAPNNLGDSRAEAAKVLLSELNGQVKGFACTDSPPSVIKNNPDYFRAFSLVIVCEITEKDLLALDLICNKFGIPLVIVRIYGMIGTCRIIKSLHTVYEIHPDAIFDMRLDAPWPSLLELNTGIDYGNLTSQASSHLPFPVLLLEASKRWRLNVTLLLY